MSRILFRLLVAVNFFFTVMFGFSGVAFTEDLQIEAPVYTAGDFWVYEQANKIKYTILVIETRENSTVVESSTRPGVRLELDRNLTIIGVAGPQAELLSSLKGWQMLNFPLFVGKKWKYTAQGNDGFGNPAMQTVEVKVKKLTTVTTPAGTFDALIIDTCWRNNNDGWTGCGVRFWYAPQVGRIIKRETPSDWPAQVRNKDFELISYELKEKRHVSAK